jgi:oxygen-independent coproporphyrinogen-3 oxidase
VRTGNAEQRRAYVETLLAEIDLHAGLDLSFDTIYFGGGTPSCLAVEDLERVVARVRGRLNTAADPWIFLEANPEDVNAANAEAWRRLGVRTLSLGVQSFDSGDLAFLGRTHSPERAREAIAIARAAGFHTLAIDLIYGLPGQTTAAWQRRIDAALETAPDHLSCYQLTVKAGTRFGLLQERGRLTQLPEAAQAAVFRATHEHLNAAGYTGYEVSSFAIGEDHRSRHNRKYWDHTPYLGLGPSAHSFDGARRWWNLRKTQDWQQAIEAGRSPVEDEETLTGRQRLLETLMMGFRTYRGVDGAELIARNGALVARLCASGLIKRQASRLIPTLDGLAVADSLATMFRLD